MGHGFNFIILMGSLILINSNYSEISNKLLGSAEPNDYKPAPPLCLDYLICLEFILKYC
jgi:hypothetical protein